MPLVDVVGSVGAVVPEHIAATGLNVGVMVGLTVTVKVAVVAHWPAVGVNVYVPVLVLLTVAGLQVPLIPLVEVVGNTGAVAPEHIAANGLNVGVIFGSMVMSSVVTIPHCPAPGVKVYVVVPVVAVLIVAGFQVPVIPLLEVVGKTGAALFWQSGPIASNVGATWSPMVILKVAVVPHCPPLGVKV
jgi:hypothetical protein